MNRYLPTEIGLFEHVSSSQVHDHIDKGVTNTNCQQGQSFSSQLSPLIVITLQMFCLPLIEKTSSSSKCLHRKTNRTEW